ncbi:hypothetical protein [Streptomyces parvulus]|uniref:hypothetical protein n=1 Tax=Streptomyces parvulus TaxID=146923 RepID=UPI0036A41370
MFEVNGASFTEGDIVRFKHATLPVNRERDYRIVAATRGGITASPVGDDRFAHEYNHATAGRLGISHTTDSATSGRARRSAGPAAG